MYDYNHIAYTLAHNKSHSFVNFYSYFKDISKYELSIIDALYTELIYSECNRPETFRSSSINYNQYNPYLLSQFKIWIELDRQNFPRISHLLHMFSYEQLYNSFQLLTHKGFIKQHTYKKAIYLLYPVLDDFLPLNFAYIKLLHNIKKLYQVKNDIINTIKSVDELKTELSNKYSNLDKTQLINLLINNDIEKINKLKKNDIDQNSVLFQSILSRLTNYVLPLALQTYLKAWTKQTPIDNNNIQSDIDKTISSILDIDLKSNNIDIENFSVPCETWEIKDGQEGNKQENNENNKGNKQTNINLQPLKLISDDSSDINLDLLASKIFNIKKSEIKADINSEFFFNDNLKIFFNSNSENLSNNQTETFFQNEIPCLPDKINKVNKVNKSKNINANKL